MILAQQSVMIKYHGTPISPRAILHNIVGGNHFCVSFNDKRDADYCVEYGQSVMFDSGAFSFFRKNIEYDPTEYINWVGQYLFHPNWAIVPDLKFNGSLEEQRNFENNNWPHRPEFSCGVYHQGEPIDRFVELCQKYGRVAIAGIPNQNPGNNEWVRWIDYIFESAQKQIIFPRIHMLRALNEASISNRNWSFYSADSATWARHHHEQGDAWKYLLMQAINCRNPKIVIDDKRQINMFMGDANA